MTAEAVVTHLSEPYDKFMTQLGSLRRHFEHAHWKREVPGLEVYVRTTGPDNSVVAVRHPACDKCACVEFHVAATCEVIKAL